jgi:fibronectin-binding autotransporter adhesin
MKKLTWIAVIAVFIVAATIFGQLQQSGGPGSTVTANAGTNLNTSALALETGGNLATIAGAISATNMKVTGTITAVTAITNPLPAGTNVLGHVITDSGTIGAVTSITNTVTVAPKTACGVTIATGSTLAAVPTSSTLLTSAATACIITATFFNTNATAATVTLTDNTATPINAMLTFSIPGNSNVIEPLEGVAFNLGVKWSASGTGVTGAVVAYQ